MHLNAMSQPCDGTLCIVCTRCSHCKHKGNPHNGIVAHEPHQFLPTPVPEALPEGSPPPKKRRAKVSA